MNVCLVSLNAKYVHLAPAPYSLGAGVAQFAKMQHKVDILNATVQADLSALAAAIAKDTPDIVGFCAYIWNIEAIKRLAREVRRLLPKATFVLGGPEVSYAVKETFSQIPEADVILSGEGEAPFAALCDALAQKTDLATVPGCSYRTEEGIAVGAPYLAKGTPPSPLAFGYAEALDGRIAYIESSRGCPFSCAFCLSGRVGGVRFFDIERVKKDILTLANAKTKTVKFVDRTFNADRARARELLSFILAHYGKEIPAGVCFHFELSGELLDAPTLALFAKAPKGLFQVEIGVQSLNIPTLSAIHRRADLPRLLENIRKIISPRNVHVHIDLIAGLPKEDLFAFESGFDQAFALGADMLQLGFLKLLHGADMREKEQEYPLSYEKTPPYQVVETPTLSQEDLAKISFCEKGCELLYNSGRYRKTLAAALQRETPFSLLCQAGKWLEKLSRPYTLEDEVSLLFAFFSTLLEREEARDLLVLDLLSHNASGYIPRALRVADPALARFRHATDQKEPKKAGVRRAYAILYTQKRGVFVDYEEKDSVTGLYPLQYRSLS